MWPSRQRLRLRFCHCRHLELLWGLYVALLAYQKCFQANEYLGYKLLKKERLQGASVFDLKLQQLLTAHSQQRGVRATHT